MKKLKIFLGIFAVILSFSLIQIKAEETTTQEITTEITTQPTAETELTTTVENGDLLDDEKPSLDLDEHLEKAKTWIVAAIIYLLSSLGVTSIGGVLLRKIKASADERIEKAVDSNIISRETANKATETVEKGIDLIGDRLQDFENKTGEKIDDLDESMKTLIEKFDTEFMSVFKNALVDYLENADDELGE